MSRQSTDISGGGYPGGTMPAPGRATTWTDNPGMMPQRLRLFLAVGFGLHGVIHTIGFVSAWSLAYTRCGVHHGGCAPLSTNVQPRPASHGLSLPARRRAFDRPEGAERAATLLMISDAIG